MYFSNHIVTGTINHVRFCDTFVTSAVSCWLNFDNVNDLWTSWYFGVGLFLKVTIV